MGPKTKKTGVTQGRPDKKSNGGSLAKKLHEEAEEAERAKQQAAIINSGGVIGGDNPEAAKNLSPLQNTQVEFIKGVFNFFMTNATSENFIVTLLLGFVINVMYVKYNDDFPQEVSTIGFCWLGALTSYVVSYLTQQKAINKAVKEGSILEDSPLATARAPSFDRIYATTLPVLICFLHRKELLVINLGLTYLLLELPSPVKMFISVSVMFNFDTSGNFLDCTFVPLFHYVLTTGLDHFVANSLTEVEKHTFAVLFINLMYAIPDSGYPVLVIFKYLVYWFGGLSVAALYLGSFAKRQASKPLRVVLVSLLYLGFVAAFYTGVVHSLTPILGQHPLAWLHQFVVASDLRLNIFKIWVLLFVVLPPVCIRVATSWDLQLRRKIWHLLLFAVLLYPLVVDPDLVALALVGLIGVFVLVELLRASEFPPFGKWLADLFLPFQDHRDNLGPVVISYLFLLVGVSLPVFLNNSVAGLVSLGVGDAAASVVGKKIGQIPWFEGKKTMEGSMAFIFSTTLAMYLYKFLGGVDYSWHTIFVSSVFTGVLEAMAQLNDNLLVPLFMYVMLEVMHYEKLI